MNKYGMRFTLSVLFMIAALLVPHSVMASTVGSCQPGGFPTISAAVAAAKQGAVIKVCPGVYGEQVVIVNPLTLEGITSSNNARVIIAVPGSGFTTTVGSIDGGKIVTPQALATVLGINISNITVDGSGASSFLSTAYFAGIFYQSGASGIINGVTTINQNGPSYSGVGIWAEKWKYHGRVSDN